MDKVRFERLLAAVGFNKITRPKRHMGKGAVKPPYWFERPKSRSRSCGVYQTIECNQNQTIRLLPEGRQITCAGCRSTWIQHRLRKGTV